MTKTLEIIQTKLKKKRFENIITLRPNPMYRTINDTTYYHKRLNLFSFKRINLTFV